MQKLIRHFNSFEMDAKAECFSFLNRQRETIGIKKWENQDIMNDLWDKPFFDYGVMPLSLDHCYEAKAQFNGK